MTLLQVLHAIVQALAGLGAHHAHTATHGANGYVVTKHWLVAACHIPAHLSGVFHCSAWIRR